MLGLDQVGRAEDRGDLLGLEERAAGAVGLRRRRLQRGNLIESAARACVASRSTRSAASSALRIDPFDTPRRRAS